MTRIQRPGSPPPVPTPGAANRKKPNRPNRPNNPTHGGGGNKKKKPSTPEAGDPTWDGQGSYLDSDVGRNDAAADPQGYFNYLTSAAGFTPGGGGLFGDWLTHGAYDTFNTGFNNARLQNPNLNVIDYAGTLGAPASAANYRQGQLQPYGQAGPATFGAGAPVDTGNPYTSSSGLNTAPVTTLPLPGQAAGHRPNGQQHPNQLKRWRQQQNAGGAVTSPPPAPTPGAGTANLGGYADNLRHQFLSLSPTQRGETSSMWETPGRWSPWG